MLPFVHTACVARRIARSGAHEPPLCPPLDRPLGDTVSVARVVRVRVWRPFALCQHRGAYCIAFLSHCEERGAFWTTTHPPPPTNQTLTLAQMALLWFVLSSLPMFNKKSAPKKDAGGRQLYAIMHHILTKNLKDCDRAMRELKGGRTFADVAKERSVCESKSGNGYLGSYETGTAIDAFEKVMWKVRIGNVVGPIQSEFGWHLLLVSSRGLREAKVEKEKEGKKTQ